VAAGQPPLLERLAQEGVALEAIAQLLELLEQQTLVAVEVAVDLVKLLAQAAQASSSFPTQAQHNYLVVELLPNQAVTSFTHSHLLAHLAPCHL
jgi:hypothetical protein